jgi:hypothetical protein
MNQLWMTVGCLALSGLAGGCSDRDATISPAPANSAAHAAASSLADAQAAHTAHAQQGAMTSTPAAPQATVAPDPAATMGMKTEGMARLMGLGPEAAAMQRGGLPAAGAPHGYHVGAVDFFLDRSAALSLSADQQIRLTAARERALLAFSTTQRRIEEAELALWKLTSDEKPDADKIDAKLDEIAKLSSGQRKDYIRAVGEALTVLTDAQKSTLKSGAAGMGPAPMSSMSNAPMTGGCMGMGCMDSMGKGPMGAGAGAMPGMSGSAMPSAGAMPGASKPQRPMPGMSSSAVPPPPTPPGSMGGMDDM